MSRIKSLPEVVLAVQKADKEQRDRKNESGPSGSAIPDVDGKDYNPIDEDEVQQQQQQQHGNTESKTDGEKTEAACPLGGAPTPKHSTGASLLKNQLSSEFPHLGEPSECIVPGRAPQEIIATVSSCPKYQIQKAEKKKTVVKKFLSNIMDKEMREKAQDVLIRITFESKVINFLYNQDMKLDHM